MNVRPVRRPEPQRLTAVAVIPARYQSTRLPGKPLIDLGGLPMIVRVVRAASRATPGLDATSWSRPTMRGCTTAVEAHGGVVP